MSSISKLTIPLLLSYFLLVVLLVVYNDYSLSPLMPLAPIVYAGVVAIVFAKRPNAFNSISILLILAIWFVRMVLNPCIYVLSGYASDIGTDAATNSLNQAIVLVSYEFIWVCFFLLMCNKIDDIDKQNLDLLYGDVSASHKIVYVVACVLLVFAVMCVMMDKSILAILSTVFDKLNNDVYRDVERRKQFLWARNNSKLIFSLFFDTIYYLQILIPAILLSLTIRKRANDGRKGLLLTVLVIFSSVVITTDNNIDSVCIMVAGFFVMILAYKKNIEHLIIPLSGLIISFIFVFLFAKSKGTIDLKYISSLLSSYFSALPNISAGFSIEYNDKLATFWGDVVAGVPYMMAFFKGYPQTVRLYNEIVHGYSGEINQIVPLITSGFHYLGFFAPAFTLFVYNLALKMETKLRKSKMVFNRVVYAVFVVNLSVGPCIFGFPNTIKRLCLFVPLYVLAVFNEYLIDSNRKE